MRRRAWMAVALAVVACEDPGGISVITGDGSFVPPALDYGRVPVRETTPLAAVLRNQTGADALVSNIRFDPETDAFAAKTEDGGPLRGAFVRQNGRVGLQVLFAPREARDYSTTMILSLGGAELALPIKAFGREPAPPKVVLVPTMVVFALAAVGSDAVERVTVRNAGESPSRLREIRPLSGDTGAFVLRAEGGGAAVPSEPLSGAQTEALVLEVHFLPREARSFEASFQLAFEDGEPAVLALAGTGAPAGRLQCDPEALEFGEVPRGTAVNARVRCEVQGGVWSLARLGLTPATASVFHLLSPPTELSATGTLEVDVAFVAQGLPAVVAGQLEIVSAGGEVTRIGLAGEVVPPASSTQALSVSLSWDTQRTDLDLHLTRSGASIFATGDDCYFAMKHPDWGVPGLADDDPFLDRDATDGLGPEEVNLTTPAEGVYDVWVHYYNYNTTASPPTRATVQWALQGSPGASEASLLLNACGSAWHVGRADFRSVPPRFEVDAAVTDQFRPFAAPRCQ